MSAQWEESIVSENNLLSSSNNHFWSLMKCIILHFVENYGLSLTLYLYLVVS